VTTASASGTCTRPSAGAAASTRSGHAARYRAALADLPLGLPEEAPDERAVYHLFTVRTTKREELRKYLHGHGIASAVHYPMPAHRQPLYRHLEATGLEESERASEEVLSLPLFAELTSAERDQVVAAVRAFFAGGG
jgi:dTDP-4-amino-4,6-dideoxygalactose transaminase